MTARVVLGSRHLWISEWPSAKPMPHDPPWSLEGSSVKEPVPLVQPGLVYRIASSMASACSSVNTQLSLGEGVTKSLVFLATKLNQGKPEYFGPSPTAASIETLRTRLAQPNVCCCELR